MAMTAQALEALIIQEITAATGSVPTSSPTTTALASAIVKFLLTNVQVQTVVVGTAAGVTPGPGVAIVAGTGTGTLI